MTTPDDLADQLRHLADRLPALTPTERAVMWGIIRTATDDGRLTPAPTPAERRDAGIALAASRWTDTERAAVRQAIRAVADTHDTFTADDVWDALAGAVPVTKGLAGLLVSAAHDGVIEHTGTTVLSRAVGDRGHVQRLAVWRSLVHTDSTTYL